MQNSIRLGSNSVQDELENQFDGLMKQRQLIQQRNKNKFKTVGNPQQFVNQQPPSSNNFSNRNYYGESQTGSRITGHEYSIIDKIQKKIISKIEQERSENREIKAKINQLQYKRQQERRKSALLEQQLQRITGINYSRNNQNIPPINYTFKPTPPLYNYPQKPPLYPSQINALSPQVTPNQIKALKEQINFLNIENNKIKQAKQSDGNLVMMLKQKVIATQQKAQQYLNLRQAYRAKLANKSDNHPQIIALLEQAEEIRGQGGKLINKKISQFNS